ncbi:MAG: RtcB family protein [Deltaproteobacteria bacterium]|nr:RtcB family protein [Deltaproteobacteria bacterium]
MTVFEPARGQRVPVHLWARDATDDTVRQLVRIASRPYVVGHVAAMADAHVAHGVAVGTVFATDGAVVPRALGGDLGCGVAATRLDLHRDALDRSTLERIVAALGRAIPTGDDVQRGGGASMPEALLAGELSTSSLSRTRDRLTPKHLGTLGGGNHFLEIDADPDGDVWLLVHSGSRGVGAAVAAHHGKAAEALDPDPLAALPADRPEGARYLEDQGWSLAFARANRDALRDRAIEVLAGILRVDVRALDHVDVHHNYVARETWSDRELILHRKGAIAAPRGARAVVPGSMGTASYVVEGLGCALAWGSCSHGAGRVLTRTEARARIRPDALARDMRRIVWPSHLGRKLVEEAPAAYRDIAEVLEAQGDLVARIVRLVPLAVLKG